ncbi:hypothetical protein LX14_001884, partial [Williamsia deligens]|nr:hypothetical protein [Williamsia deligens]
MNALRGAVCTFRVEHRLAEGDRCHRFRDTRNLSVGDRTIEHMSGTGMFDTSGVVASLAADSALPAHELVEILSHCRAITSSADYRMLCAASLIHDERCEDYLVEVAEHESGQRKSLDELLAAGMDHLAGRDPRAEYGPDGLERATAEVGAVLNVPAS